MGKIAIPKEILNKPAKLTDEEFALMKTHTIEGQFMLDRVGGLLGRVGEIVRSCHERWDGSGLPRRPGGRADPARRPHRLRCDAYNAMTTDRPYRARDAPRGGRSRSYATNAGTQFDPACRRALIEVIEEGEPSRVRAADEMRALLAEHARTRAGRRRLQL